MIDFEVFFTSVGKTDPENPFDILVMAEVPNQSTPTPIFGVKDVALHDPVVLDFDFPSGNWQLLGTTKGGWPAHQDNYAFQWTVATVLICLVLSILGFILYLSDSRGVLRRRFSDAIRSLGDGFAMFSPEGRLVAYNDKYVELYDTVADLIERSARFEDLIRAGAARGQIASAIGREEEWVQERIHLFATTTTRTEQDLKNGRHIRVTDHRTDSGDVVCMRVDVTELNVAKERAEAASMAKTTFLNTLSHELRTPLTVILAISRFFANIERLPAAKDVANAFDLGSPDPAEIRTRVESLLRLISEKMKMQERSGEHLLSMINEILDMAKIESGNLSVDLNECHATDILNSIKGQLRQAAEQKGLKLAISGADQTVLADEARTRQILLNLIGNAIKFTDSGVVSVEIRRKGTRVEFAVTDTGIGIARSDMTRIFEPFQQVDSSDTRSRSGTGLGLAISAELARLQNGMLSVESEPGVGSTFVLSLEATEALSKAV